MPSHQIDVGNYRILQLNNIVYIFFLLPVPTQQTRPIIIYTNSEPTGSVMCATICFKIMLDSVISATIAPS